MLLFWPCAWGLTIAYDFNSSLKLYFFYMFLFLTGSILMRSAGCVVNDIVDRYFEWPLSDADFERFVNDKYANADATHHHEITRSSGKTTGDGPDDFSHKIEVNETEAGAESVSNFEFERRLQDKKRQIKLLDPRYLPMFLEEFERLIRR